MGYFGTMSEKKQYGREERIDYYKRYRFFKELAEETSEQDDWAFEESLRRLIAQMLEREV